MSCGGMQLSREQVHSSACSYLPGEQIMLCYGEYTNLELLGKACSAQETACLTCASAAAALRRRALWLHAARQPS